jgi:hypothetical protein
MKLSTLPEVARDTRAWLTSPTEPVVLAWFRRMFFGKFLLYGVLDLFKPGGAGSAAWLRTAILAGCVVLPEHPRGLRVSASVLLGFKIADIVSSFPFTINHAFFDGLLLLALASRRAEPAAGGPCAVRVAQAAMLLVFFYTGVQKVVHGYYWDGQFFALRLLYHEGDMGRRLRALFRAIGSLLALPPSPAHAAPRPHALAEVPANLPAWVWLGLRSLSVGTWMAEIGLPLLALRPTLRRGAVLALVGLEAAILVFTGEVHFGFTVVACLLCFFPREARWSYPISMLFLSAAAALKR